jgi:hypothetical protein
MNTPDPGVGYQINRQGLGHPDSGSARQPPSLTEMGGDPRTVDRPVHPMLALVVGLLGLGGLVLSVFVYLWAGLFVAFLVGLVACALVGAAIAARRS